MRLGISRPGLGLATSLVDKLVGSEDQVYNANKKIMPNLCMHSRCLTECQVHLGSSWGGQKLQTNVSLYDKEGC